MSTTPEFVRVDTGNGAKASVNKVYAESVGLTILDEPATTPGGKPLSATYPEAEKVAEKSPDLDDDSFTPLGDAHLGFDDQA